MSERRLFAAFIGGRVVFIVAFVLLINTVAHHYDRVNCTAFGVNSGREVKFVDYSYFSWACLTPTSNGMWINTDNLREI